MMKMSPRKRQRISNKLQTNDESNQHSKNRTLETLPPEVLEMIFKFLPYDDVATSVRLVSRQCQMVATSILNGAFYSTGYRLDAIMSQIQTTITTTKNDMYLVAYSNIFNILELIRAQYKMLRAVTWRYTHPPRPGQFDRLCFYAGSLLDEMNNLLNLAASHPSTLINFKNLDNDVTRFFILCKRFMNYFEKVSERKLNRSALVSGCKAVDVLDCLATGREIQSFRLTTGRNNRGKILCMKIRYIMRRSWFTCLEVPRATNETSWRDKQKFMYLRLRRLVGSVNEFHFENLHCKREQILENRLLSPRLPQPSTYVAYGEYAGQFFYYGSMNKYAYAIRFNRAIEPEDYDDYDESTNSKKTENTFDLDVCVDIRCTPELAPWSVRSILKSDDFENCQVSQNPELYLKMKITCPASIKMLLPGHFIWEQRAPQPHRNT